MTYEEEIEYDRFRSSFPYKTMEVDLDWKWENNDNTEREYDHLSLDNVISDRVIANDILEKIDSINTALDHLYDDDLKQSIKDKLVVLLSKTLTKDDYMNRLNK
jgi:hypothetical protein